VAMRVAMGKPYARFYAEGLTRSAQPSTLFFVLFYPFPSFDLYK